MVLMELRNISIGFTGKGTTVKLKRPAAVEYVPVMQDAHALEAVAPVEGMQGKTRTNTNPSNQLQNS
jgi:hypothetical protein